MDQRLLMSFAVIFRSRIGTVCALGLLAVAGCEAAVLEVKDEDDFEPAGDSGTPPRPTVDAGGSGGGRQPQPGPVPSGDGGTTSPNPPAATLKKRLTGIDLDTSTRWKIAGTDLGIPYVLENGSIGYLFGDTYATATPFDPNPDWRAPIMLRSATAPGDPGGIVFDSAARVPGDGRAPDIMPNAKDMSLKPGAEWTVIPNDGISFPETKRQLISFASLHSWEPVGPAQWQTNYAGIAYSDNGNSFTRVTNLTWPNNADFSDPYQVWTMQRDGDYVYVYSVRAGRQPGPMMLRRVPWEKLFDKTAYECWGSNGTDSAWGRPCTALLDGHFGEPSVRRLKDGTWAMAYLNCKSFTIVTRTATTPTGPWSAEKTQVTFAQEPYLYGGFIHPWSETGTNKLHIMVSKFSQTEYHVSQYVGSL